MSQHHFIEPGEVKDAIAKVSALLKPPVIIEVIWDGHTSGWRAEVCAVVEEPSQNHPTYKEYFLASFAETPSDWRLPKYEGVASIGGAQALELATTLSEKFGVPIYFLSPDSPEDECARWWERDKGVPCQRCGKLLVQGKHGRCRGSLTPGTCRHRSSSSSERSSPMKAAKSEAEVGIGVRRLIRNSFA